MESLYETTLGRTDQPRVGLVTKRDSTEKELCAATKAIENDWLEIRDDNLEPKRKRQWGDDQWRRQRGANIILRKNELTTS